MNAKRIGSNVHISVHDWTARVISHVHMRAQEPDAGRSEGGGD